MTAATPAAAMGARPLSKPFSLLVKPASADCNLRCRYCFYLDRLDLYPDQPHHRMSPETLEAMIRSYMATPQPQYTFGWQGGEPTLMGLDFFKQVNALQQRYGPPGAMVCNGLQTNGTMIDDDMARHFGEYHYLLGVSLDGPPAVHDHYRRTIGGESSHHQVVRGIDRLKRHGVEFNILTLVNDQNGKDGAAIYRYLRDKGFLFHQYIPCVEFAEDGGVMPFSVPATGWGDFLCAVFDEWYKTDTRVVSVRLFDTILQYLVEGVRNCCNMGTDCRQYFVVEWNGDIYPCDFFVYDDLRLSNVGGFADGAPWRGLQESEAYAAFGCLKQRMHATCTSCRHLEICGGDCIKERPGRYKSPENLSYLCAGWQRFYDHVMPRMRELAEMVKRERAEAMRQQAAAARRAPPSHGVPPGPGGAAAGTTGRPTGKPKSNAPCPCGSGKKFKRCCGS